MMRKLVIGLAAAVLVTGGATLGASAYPAGGGGYKGGGHGMGRPGMGRPGMGGRYGRQGMGGAYGRADRHGDWRWRPHHHWPRYGHRPYYYGGYGSGGSCWRNVWTPDGWQRQYVCGSGYGRPYGYSYRRHWRGGPHYGQLGGRPWHPHPWYGRR